MPGSGSSARRVLLLGGTGFIGGPLASRLRTRGDRVETLSRSATADWQLDATDSLALREILQRESFDAVVNLMGVGLATATADESSLLAVNSHLPAAALKALLDTGRDTTFIHAASSTERTSDDEPDESDYSRTKHLGSVALRSLASDTSTPVTLLHIHNTYGPHQPRTRFIANTLAALAQGTPVLLNYPHRVRDFVFLDDVIESFVAALDNARPGLHEADIGTGIGTSLIDTARLIAAAVEADPSLVQAATSPVEDPRPYTVASPLGGTFGTCRTSLTDGLMQTIGDH